MQHPVRLPGYPRCFGELLARNLARGNSTGLGVGAGPTSEVVSARSVPPPAGATAEIDVVVTLSGLNASQEVHTASVVVVRERVESTVTVSHFTSPPDRELVDRVAGQLIRKSADR